MEIYFGSGREILHTLENGQLDFNNNKWPVQFACLLFGLMTGVGSDEGVR